MYISTCAQLTNMSRWGRLPSDGSQPVFHRNIRTNVQETRIKPGALQSLLLCSDIYVYLIIYSYLPNADIATIISTCREFKQMVLQTKVLNRNLPETSNPDSYQLFTGSTSRILWFLKYAPKSMDNVLLRRILFTQDWSLSKRCFDIFPNPRKELIDAICDGNVSSHTILQASKYLNLDECEIAQDVLEREYCTDTLRALSRIDSVVQKYGQRLFIELIKSNYYNDASLLIEKIDLSYNNYQCLSLLLQDVQGQFPKLLFTILIHIRYKRSALLTAGIDIDGLLHNWWFVRTWKEYGTLSDFKASASEELVFEDE